MITHIDGLSGAEEQAALEILNDKFEEQSDLDMQEIDDIKEHELMMFEQELDRDQEIGLVGGVWN